MICDNSSAPTLQTWVFCLSNIAGSIQISEGGLQRIVRCYWSCIGFGSWPGVVACWSWCLMFSARPSRLYITPKSSASGLVSAVSIGIKKWSPACRYINSTLNMNRLCSDRRNKARSDFHELCDLQLQQHTRYVAMNERPNTASWARYHGTVAELGESFWC